MHTCLLRLFLSVRQNVKSVRATHALRISATCPRLCLFLRQNATRVRSIPLRVEKSPYLVVHAAAEPLVGGEIRAFIRYARNPHVVHVRPGLEAHPSAFGNVEHTSIDLLSKPNIE